MEPLHGKRLTLLQHIHDGVFQKAALLLQELGRLVPPSRTMHRQLSVFLFQLAHMDHQLLPGHVADVHVFARLSVLGPRPGPRGGTGGAAGETELFFQAGDLWRGS